MPDNSLWVLVIQCDGPGKIEVFENYGEVIPRARLAERHGLEAHYWNLYGAQKPAKREPLKGEK